MRPLIIEVRQNRVVLRDGFRCGAVLLDEAATRPSALPVVKWAGGKQWLATLAPRLVPQQWTGRYYEPFVGGGAFFFAVAPHQGTLSDTNQELITAYRAVRDDPEGLIRLLRRYRYDRDFYYRLRRRVPRSRRAAAARLIYLNKTCWNGLYRVNQKGKFNTPIGRFSDPTICDSGRIRVAAKLFRRIRLATADFEAIVSSAKPGDFVYLDPPYVAGHNNNGFLKYSARLFSWSDQVRLARCAIQLADAGVHVLVSNADQPAVVGLYKGLIYYRAIRRSLIGAQKASRGVVAEALLSSYPLFDSYSEVIS